MRTTSWMTGIALAGLLALAGAGCKKEGPGLQTPTFNKVPVDIPKLSQAMAPAGQSAHTVIVKLKQNLRYHQYDAALAALDSLKEMPDVNDSQKKVIDQVSEQVKQAAKANEAAAPAPASAR